MNEPEVQLFFLTLLFLSTATFSIILMKLNRDDNENK
jgi:hypothetical protein